MLARAQALRFEAQRYVRQGQYERALPVYRDLLLLESENAEILYEAGLCFHETGDLAQAIEHYLRSLMLESHAPDLHHNLGIALFHAGHRQDGVEHLTMALALNPASALYNKSLGGAYRVQCQYAMAAERFRAAVAIDAKDAVAIGALGEALSNLYAGEARAWLQRAVELMPADVDAHMNLAFDCLRHAEYEAGWKEYEWRTTKGHLPPIVFPNSLESLRGRSVYIEFEQGFGDWFQFSRYLPALLDQGATLIVAVPQPLVRLMEVWAGNLCPPGELKVVELTARARDVRTDYSAPLLSLPHLLREGSIPPPVRFTKRPVGKILAKRRRPRVGFVWSGSPDHVRNEERSVPLPLFASLLQEPACDWVCLQEGARDSDFQLLQQTPELCQFPDFLETANLLDSLDLVISVDTAVAHLALSQGIDTWVLLPYAADWRWLEPDVEENPWYPAARTFRPRSAGATLTEMWSGVLLDVRDSLRTWLSHTV